MNIVNGFLISVLFGVLIISSYSLYHSLYQEIEYNKRKYEALGFAMEKLEQLNSTINRMRMEIAYFTTEEVIL